jgi:hypothetical protein
MKMLQVSSPVNDIQFQNCSKLMFSNYIKLFSIVNSQLDADLLQSELNTLYD